jgi:AmmeMemoRadiSam system protein B
MEKVRPSAIAGAWYPGSQDELRKVIQNYFDRVGDVSVNGEVVGLISPHAGFMYSGQTAAYGYRLVSGKVYDTVVVIAPMHRVSPGRYIATDVDYYETPLGRVPVDKDSLDCISRVTAMEMTDFDEEHSLEIQLPFLQVALGDFSLLPILVGHGNVHDVEDMVQALVSVAKQKKMLFVASTDLHHIPDYEAVKKKDRKVVDALKGGDLERIRRVLAQPDCSVCGRVPVSVVLDTAQRLDAKELAVLHQANSGDVTGDRTPGQYTVGYLSAALVA